MFNVNPGVMASLAGSSVSYKLIDILTRLGLTTSLDCCLDVGDIDSYDGTSQTWTDVSGGGNHYFRGLNGSASSDDPTFNGTAGDLSESTYFSFDGLDYFNETTAQTFSEPWHKNNGVCTCIAIYYTLSNKATITGIWSNRTVAAGAAGISFTVSNNNFLRLIHSTTTAASETIVGTVVVPGGYNFIGQSLNEPGLSVIFRVNSSTETVAATGSTDTDASSSPIVIGAVNISAQDPSYFENTERLMCMALWSRALTDTEMASIYTQLKNRVPSIP